MGARVLNDSNHNEPGETMSHEQKKNRIIERAVTFTGLRRSVAAELAGDAKDLSIRKLRRIIGVIQHDQAEGLHTLRVLVAQKRQPGPKARAHPAGP